MFFVACRLVLGGVLLLVVQKALMLLFQKTSSAYRVFVVGGLDTMDRKALKTGMLIVSDPKIHTEFMVDSGSRRSVIPCHRPATHPRLTGFMSCLNGSEVPTFESVELELTLNLGRSFTWTFVQADVLFATLGLDFLNHFGVFVDARRGRFVLPDENPVKPPYVFGDSLARPLRLIDLCLSALIVRSRPFRTPRSCSQGRSQKKIERGAKFCNF